MAAKTTRKPAPAPKAEPTPEQKRAFAAQVALGYPDLLSLAMDVQSAESSLRQELESQRWSTQRSLEDHLQGFGPRTGSTNRAGELAERYSNAARALAAAAARSVRVAEALKTLGVEVEVRYLCRPDGTPAVALPADLPDEVVWEVAVACSAGAGVWIT